jgi:4'-phosphopantetheinyl transferase
MQTFLNLNDVKIVSNHKQIVLRCGDVHVWRAFFRGDSGSDSVLTAEELLRAKRLVRSTDQERFIFSRVVLRRILSHYLSISPEKIEFAVGEHGKPFVRDTDVHFNLSHSGDCVLIGVTLNNPIGVDVECVRQKPDYMALAKRFFCPAEFLAIQLSEKPIEAFYRCWTRKEAFLKATGLGLTFGLANFEVSISVSAQQSALLNVRNKAYDASAWFVQSVSLGEGASSSYYAAIATPQLDHQVFYYDF